MRKQRRAAETSRRIARSLACPSRRRTISASRARTAQSAFVPLRSAGRPATRRPHTQRHTNPPPDSGVICLSRSARHSPLRAFRSPLRPTGKTAQQAHKSRKHCLREASLGAGAGFVPAAPSGAPSSSLLAAKTRLECSCAAASSASTDNRQLMCRVKGRGVRASWVWQMAAFE
jgi:hypothetical protein